MSYTKVWQNSTYGALAYGVGAYPEFDHSKIADNGLHGVRAEVNGNPILGNASLGIGQNNSIYGQTKNVYNATSNTVYAENCWWGVAPPTKTMFYGSVDYTPYLTSDPVPYLASRRPQTPKVLALAQNYPNPFGAGSGTTSIGYSIPASGKRVILRVYDVSGRLVRTLVDGPKGSNRYVATWDGKNEHGNQVAAGIYLYKLQFGSQSITKKLVIVR